MADLDSVSAGAGGSVGVQTNGSLPPLSMTGKGSHPSPAVHSRPAPARPSAPARCPGPTDSTQALINPVALPMARRGPLGEAWSNQADRGGATPGAKIRACGRTVLQAFRRGDHAGPTPGKPSAVTGRTGSNVSLLPPRGWRCHVHTDGSRRTVCRKRSGWMGLGGDGPSAATPDRQPDPSKCVRRNLVLKQANAKRPSLSFRHDERAQTFRRWRREARLVWLGLSEVSCRSRLHVVRSGVIRDRSIRTPASCCGVSIAAAYAADQAAGRRRAARDSTTRGGTRSACPSR